MACRRINYPHDLLGVSETLQPDYPRIPPDHGWSTFSAMTRSLQLSSTFVDRGRLLFFKKIAEGLRYQESDRLKASRVSG